MPRAAVTTRSGVDYVRLTRGEGPLDVAVVFAEFRTSPEMTEILTGLRPATRCSSHERGSY